LFDALDRLKYNINDFNKKFENNIQLFDTKFSVQHYFTLSGLRFNQLSGSIGTVIVEHTKSQKGLLGSSLTKIGYEPHGRVPTHEGFLSA
jgi:hypothetical protein